MPSIQVVPRALSSCRDERVFLFIEKRRMQVKNKFSDKQAYPKIYYDLFAKQSYRKSEGFEVYSSFLHGICEFRTDRQKRENRTIIHLPKKKTKNKYKREKILEVSEKYKRKKHTLQKNTSEHFERLRF